MSWSIRNRLTLWNAVVFATIISGMGLVLYSAFAQTLLNRVDSVLEFEYKETIERLEGLGADEDLGGIPQAFLDEFLLRVTDGKGRVRMESPALQGINWQFSVSEYPNRTPKFTTSNVDDLGEQRIVYGQAGGSHEGWNIQIAIPLSDYRRDLSDLRFILLILFPASLLMVTVAGYYLAGRALAPVEQITIVARQISSQNLAERIPLARVDDELGRLTSTLNAMVDRLADAMNANRRFTADASHELMTPLSQIRTELEVTLQRERSSREYQQILLSTLQEVERLTRLSKQLLELAKEDAGVAPPCLEDCAIHEIVQASVQAYTSLAEEADVRLLFEQVHPVTLCLDPDYLRHAIDNLIQNAIQYNRPGGEISVSLKVENQIASIVVSDTGCGIPSNALPHIFDRFFRVDRARSRRTGGNGLGLSISRLLIGKLNGRIEVESIEGMGCTFRILFPVHRPNENRFSIMKNF